ncbi:DUF3445 domain-containing protein [Ammoniphilus sp. CFH 90114]|uniref:heme-dependent oxidative N-demethylase family protein n=1 Tax=Ammoniphilus sp. CFH 90114 TaxID=2493665 RepID=UPI00100DB825|nr:DUF3445 domain-containing protein [Ammoniphilus sp. CFH 90114]RXT04275.1 DUF3445 domain-containing protein [Ammoniphilus sp. CFH 90114]
MTNQALLDSFPFPLRDDIYRFSNNSIPLVPPCSIDVTSTYVEEVKSKRDLLSSHPNRCYQSTPHTMTAQWEIVDLVAHHLATYFPDQFHLEKHGNRWTIGNEPLGERVSFTFGDSSTLPQEPLDFIGRHVQEDLILMMQRDGNLFLDAGQLCFPANWSLAFDLGMTFKEIHKPIPGFQDHGLDDRILNFLMRLEAGQPWGRRNWSMMAGSRLDTSLETFDEWGKARHQVTMENVGELVHLRVEVQKLFRLPRSHGIFFTIHSHMLPLHLLKHKPEWLQRFYLVLSELPHSIADYKGIGLYRNTAVEYLKRLLDESR